MSSDFSTYPTGDTGWHALIDHAIKLGGDLSEVEWFELKDRLDFTQQSERKASAFQLAKAIIGMANRMPDAAARHLSGHGVILVGFKDGAVVGAERVDGAVLQDLVGPYVTQDHLSWDHQYIQHPDGLVMAVTVMPPKAGHPIFALQKEFSAAGKGSTYRAATVFVRVPGQTRQQTVDDLKNLQRRLVAAPQASAELELRFSDGFERIDIQSAVTLMERYVNKRADALLADVKSANTSTPSLLAGLGGRRSQFIRAVEDWRSEARDLAPDVAMEFVRYERALVHLTLVNGSNVYMDGVEVRIEFPPGISVLVRSDTDYRDHDAGFHPAQLFPNPPDRWEAFSTYGNMSSILPPLPTSSSFPSMSEFSVDELDDGGCVLTWDLGVLRPKRSERSDETIALVAATDVVAPVAVEWQATARGIDHVFADSVSLPGAHDDNKVMGWLKPDDEQDGEQAG